MRVSLARALFNTEFVIIDSDLMSLDKNTRTKVFRNIKEYASKASDVVVVVKGRKGDEDLDRNIQEYITV